MTRHVMHIKMDDQGARCVFIHSHNATNSGSPTGNQEEPVVKRQFQSL